MSLSYPMTTSRPVATLDSFKRRIDTAIEVAGELPFALREELPGIVKSALSYKKVGGLHFAKVGNASVSWSFKRPKAKAVIAPVIEAPAFALPSPDQDAIAARISRFVK